MYEDVCVGHEGEDVADKVDGLAGVAPPHCRHHRLRLAPTAVVRVQMLLL